ncbi:O-antigen/teichoic acid export membrane protein [Vibrio crassostreae]|uniref:lipopolysaccharide biosynthesis protein n=1 Tax=Vibrio crassostreae TaxID=246167 RepID=UPI000F4648C8|nr:oligosaccharide flippase family protein [Vibrio crassostreae]ROO66105.1 O-antigen/teichoic acid export membrane protein [Vibrio crassostreae]ROP03208.1 O-antigen/teichoic acid export membrane protein [Vibrio crassostreae]ROQ72026.1 O-antigen/teichoic acid export membrane protein [Vibrio crassostreae]ROR77635.1 O-antigen/teichoic acid export membrane protein [Vibrio crassostreae]RPE88052.1 O-antigen/teichoic acid export membrane protein [Vibrio crassostreae]
MRHKKKEKNGLFRGSLYRTVVKISTMGLSFIILPIIVMNLGNSYYGVWVLISSLGGYYGALDFGLSSAVVRYASKHIDDDRELKKYLATSSLMFIFVFVLVCLLSLILYGLIYYYKFSVVDSEVVAIASLYTGLSIAVSFLSKTAVGVITSHIRYDIISVINLCTSLYRTLLIYILMTNGYGIISLSLVLLTSSVFEMLSLNFYASKFHNNYWEINNVKLENAKKLMSFAKYSFLAQISDILRNNSFPLIISMILGAALVTPFSIATKVWLMVASVSSAMLSIYTPVFSKFNPVSELDEIRTLYFKALKFSNYIGVYSCFLFLIIINDFLNIWLGEALANDVRLITISLSFATIASISQMPTVNLLYGLGKNKYYAYSNFSQGAIGAIVCAFTLKYSSLEYMVISISLLGVIVKSVVQPFIAIKVINISIVSYYRNYLSLFLTPLIYSCFSWLLYNKLNSTNIYFIFAFCVSNFFVYSFLIYKVFLSDEERNKIKIMVNKNERKNI